VELTPLRYFRAIAEAGHMTRAAEALGVTQPALSAVVRKLEDEVGAALLHRTGKGVALTDAGRVFLARAEESLRAADEAIAQVRELVGLEQGSIRLGGGATAITYLLPSVISHFLHKHPGLRFYVREAGSRTVGEAVFAGELDLGVVTLPVDLPGSRELLVTPWIEDELRLITPPGHRLAGRRTFRWKELEGEPMVGLEGGSAVRNVIDRAAASHGVALDIVMELRSIESIKQMGDAGVGVGIISRAALQSTGGRGGQSQGLSCKDGPITRTLALIRRNDRMPSPAAAALEAAMLDRRKT
jgi:DNA-binding transcriptional LysR family regulator